MVKLNSLEDHNFIISDREKNWCLLCEYSVICEFVRPVSMTTICCLGWRKHDTILQMFDWFFCPVEY